MRFDKRRVLGNAIEYICDIFADSKNDVLIINKIEGHYGLKDEKDICREFILNSLKEVNQSPYYEVNLYDNTQINSEINEAIEYLMDKVKKLEVASEVNNIINKVYED